MDLLGALDVLVRVVETGSFSAVARERQLSQAAVARQISQLEDHFGVPYFTHDAKAAGPTNGHDAAGPGAAGVLEGVKRGNGSGARAASRLTGRAGAGGATVSASRFLALRLPTLLAEHPGLKVVLVVGDRLGDMIEDRLDLAMRLGEIERCVAGGAAERDRCAHCRDCADYIEQHGKPATPADLASRTCIVPRHRTGFGRLDFFAPEGPRDVRVSGGFLANDVRAVHLATRTGYGIAYLTLVEVFDGPCQWRAGSRCSTFRPRHSVSPVYPSRRDLRPARVL